MTKNFTIKYLEFESALRYFFYDVKNKVSKDDALLLDDIKQAVIVFVMKDRFGESNDVFLSNMKSDFYEAIEQLEGRHPDVKNKTKVVKNFMEEFYFTK